MKNSTISKISSWFGFDANVGEKIWKHGWIYFTELLSLWIITTNNATLNLKVGEGDFSFGIIQIQTLGFLLGAFYFGWFVGESRNKGKVKHIDNLMQSIGLYCFGTLLSILSINSIEESTLTGWINWVFAFSRFITCFAIAGGIGINLTIISQSVKDRKYSAPILLFTAFGVAGTAFSCGILALPKLRNIDLTIYVFGLSLIMGAYQFFRLKKDKNNSREVEYTNSYKYNINKSEFWTRILSFVFLGLPTFFLAGILASNAGKLVQSGTEVGVNQNAIFLGIQYIGFTIICILFSLPSFNLVFSVRGRKFMPFNFRVWITERRKFVLSIGALLQGLFLGAFLSSLLEGSSFKYPLILLSGAGIGINWGIIMIMIFDQDEFENSKTFAATIIPNLIRFSLALIMVFPLLLDMRGREGDINQLKGLAILVYIPFIFTLLTFKEEGEKKTRYKFEKKSIKNIVDDIIKQKKVSNNDVPVENIIDSLKKSFQELKDKLSEELERFDFEFINFYYKLEGAKVDGTNDYKISERVKPIKRILRKTIDNDSISLLEISSKERLNCMVIYQAKQNPYVNNDDILTIDIGSKKEEEIVANFEKDLKKEFEEEEKYILEDNFRMYIQADKSGKDYFVYLIRPIEDFEDVVPYIVLLTSSALSVEAIGSFQTLIDLTLLSYSKLNQRQLRVTKKQLEIDLITKQENNLSMREEINQLRKKFGILPNLENNIMRWQNYAKHNNIVASIEEIETYIRENDLRDLLNECIQLAGRWNELQQRKRNGDIGEADVVQMLNTIRISLLELLSNLEKHKK